MIDLDPTAALVLFSGGQDSTTCLAWALERYARVETVGFHYGQRHAIEMEMRGPVRAALRDAMPRWAPRLGADHVVPLDVLGRVSRSALTSDLPAAARTQGLPATFVPPGNAQPARGEKAWPALRAALATLDHAAPSLATQLRADFASSGGETLAAALLYLVASLRGGSDAAWPGAAIERALLDAGRADLAKHLGDELGAARNLAETPATAPWQVFILPLVDGAQVRPIRLYLKRRGEDGRGGKGGDENARFVLEFELKRFGTMQLDGFVRPRRFDLALRSHAPLADSLRQEVAHIFHDRLAAAGLTGEIDFATVAQFPVAPLDALRRPVGMAV